MAKCVFLSTYEENVECFKECPLYNWEENSNKCPFTEIKGRGRKVRNLYDFDFYKDERDDKDLGIANLYKDNYI
ncbi:MAG: hypothetical protein E6344_15615 [Clostridium sp.]|uniref:hypothetical protein n=1 Tax=Clostridium culturomicium TaxID=1499683 RepID=UPI000590E4F6|nr:hypothetical protein [Clostridium culturomicium]MDU4891318.1 hypothetical protein [Clostridium sp.]MDU7085122.1 hypothetical protein [Clostridium sp.]